VRTQEQPVIRSMTGFGRASFQVDELCFDVEVRSVNHRYLDSRVRLPRLLSSCEADVRARIQARFARGKVDASVNSAGGGAAPAHLEIDVDAARAYLGAAAALERDDSVPGSLDVGVLLGLPGVSRFVEPQLSAEALREALLGAVDSALEALAGMRAAEGGALEKELLERVAAVERMVVSLESRASLVQDAVRERLRRRSEQLARETGLHDEARLHQEIVLAADRLDVTEEIVRLRSHVEQFRAIVAEAGEGKPVGRRLDFLLQEFGREANTIGSKGSDAPIAHEIVELKTEIERIREQVQNVE
jgi:uncharacterized protein (TIGR00255 family)